MLANLSALPNLTTTTLPTPTEITPGLVENERIFFQTATARGISGIFVWLSLIITCHQVSNCANFGLKDECTFIDSQNESVQVRTLCTAINTTKDVQLFEVLVGIFMEFLSVYMYTIKRHFLENTV